MYDVTIKDTRRGSTAVSTDHFSFKSEEEIENDAANSELYTGCIHKWQTSHMSWGECTFKIFFTIQGPAFFMLPSRIKNVGYLAGMVCSFGAALFYIYTVQTYLWCEREIRRQKCIRDEKQLSIFAMIDCVFVDSTTMRRLGHWLKVYLKYEIILSWSSTLSFGELFVCGNIRLILRYFGYTMTDRIILLLLFPITTLLALVPNIKMVSIVSYFSIIVISAKTIVIMLSAIADPTPLAGDVTMISDLSELPRLTAIVFFNIVCTPLIFSWKNEMKYPQSFGSCFGSFNTAIVLFIVSNVSFSLFCYFKYGLEVHENVMENLPSDLFTALSDIVFTFAMLKNGADSFFIVFDTIWDQELKKIFSKFKHVRWYEYATRVTINFLVTTMALAIPSLDVFVDLISCFSYSYDSIFLPIALHAMLSWKRQKHSSYSAVVIFMNLFFFIGFLCFTTSLLWVCVREIVTCETPIIV